MTRRISVYNYPHARKKRNECATKQPPCCLFHSKISATTWCGAVGQFTCTWPINAFRSQNCRRRPHNCKKVHNDQILTLWATRATRKPLIT